MKIYQVGGCVRDHLLGLNPKDIDYVVIGSTPEEMLSLNFEQVGAAFPVFLHPETKDEYALARKEVKTGAGYLAFETETKGVTLEEDLYRRDLTINAMAMDDNGSIIDPFNGQKDLKNGILRHVSSHFNEDPVRLLRIARFAARYNFSVAPETYELLQGMVEAGEVDSLQGERVFLELEKTMKEPHVERFFEVLEKSNACGRIFPFNSFPSIEQFSPNNTERDNRLIILSKMSPKDLDKIKATALDKELVKTYKHFFTKGQSYSEMSADDKITFIKSTKAIHEHSRDPEIIHNIFSHINRFIKPIDVQEQEELVFKDVERIKNHPFETRIKEFKEKFPKGNIGEFTKNEFLSLVSDGVPSHKKSVKP